VEVRVSAEASTSEILDLRDSISASFPATAELRASTSSMLTFAKSEVIFSISASFFETAFCKASILAVFEVEEEANFAVRPIISSSFASNSATFFFMASISALFSSNFLSAVSFALVISKSSSLCLVWVSS